MQTQLSTVVEVEVEAEAELGKKMTFDKWQPSINKEMTFDEEWLQMKNGSKWIMKLNWKQRVIVKYFLKMDLTVLLASHWILRIVLTNKRLPMPLVARNIHPVSF